MSAVDDVTTFAVVFLDSTTGVAATPSAVKLWVREEIDGTELYYDLSTTPVSPGITNPGTATGVYQLKWLNRKPERLTAVWIGSGNNVNQTKTQTVLVRHSLVSDQEI